MRGRIVCDRLLVRGGPKMAGLSGQPFFLTIEKSRFAPSGTTQEHEISSLEHFTREAQGFSDLP